MISGLTPEKPSIGPAAFATVACARLCRNASASALTQDRFAAQCVLIQVRHRDQTITDRYFSGHFGEGESVSATQGPLTLYIRMRGFVLSGILEPLLLVFFALLGPTCFSKQGKLLPRGQTHCRSGAVDLHRRVL